MQHEPRMSQQPAVHHRRPAGGEAAADHTDRQAGPGLAAGLAREAAEARGPVPSGSSFPVTLPTTS
jgi:hypothetical protein